MCKYITYKSYNRNSIYVINKLNVIVFIVMNVQKKMKIFGVE